MQLVGATASKKLCESERDEYTKVVIKSTAASPLATTVITLPSVINKMKQGIASGNYKLS